MLILPDSTASSDFNHMPRTWPPSRVSVAAWRTCGRLSGVCGHIALRQEASINELHRGSFFCPVCVSVVLSGHIQWRILQMSHVAISMSFGFNISCPGPSTSWRSLTEVIMAPSAILKGAELSSRHLLNPNALQSMPPAWQSCDAKEQRCCTGFPAQHI